MSIGIRGTNKKKIAIGCLPLLTVASGRSRQGGQPA